MDMYLPRGFRTHSSKGTAASVVCTIDSETSSSLKHVGVGNKGLLDMRKQALSALSHAFGSGGNIESHLTQANDVESARGRQDSELSCFPS